MSRPASLARSAHGAKPRQPRRAQPGSTLSVSRQMSQEKNLLYSLWSSYHRGVNYYAQVTCRKSGSPAKPFEIQTTVLIKDNSFFLQKLALQQVSFRPLPPADLRLRVNDSLPGHVRSHR